MEGKDKLILPNLVSFHICLYFYNGVVSLHFIVGTVDSVASHMYILQSSIHSLYGIFSAMHIYLLTHTMCNAAVLTI